MDDKYTNRRPATAASWKIRPMPEQQKELLVDGRYSREEFERIRLGLVPQSPEDKWFIYLADGWLHFHRSQTGTCIFQLELLPNGDDYVTGRAIVNRAPNQYRVTDDEYDVELMSYLVDHLLLGRFAPLPIPNNLAEDDHSRYRRHVMGRPSGSNGLNLRVLNNGKR